MRRLRFWCAVAVLAVFPTTAGADMVTIEDERTPGQAVDPVAATHGHQEGARGILVHSLEMQQPWQDGDLLGAVIDVWLPGTGRGVDRMVSLSFNPDRSMKVIVTNVRGRVRGHGNAWMPDERSLRIEFARRLLGRDVDRYRWRITVSVRCDDGVPEPCMPRRDRVPSRGAVLHELR